MAISWTVLLLIVCVQLAKGATINEALNKPAKMSSVYSHDLNADKAVDGDQRSHIMTIYRKNCAWWMVDLQTVVQDATVKIYFRTDNTVHRNGVQFYTSTTPFSSYPEGHLCHTIVGWRRGGDIPNVVSVNCTGTWRYLLVYTDTDNGYHILLDFAEVEVLVCPNGTYGPTCTKSCDSRQCAVTPTSCDRYTGACPPVKCHAGWIGIDCTEECTNGTYGTNCVKSCSDRLCRTPSSTCDHETGQCPDGCLDGWTGKDCSYECPNGTYGVNCKSCSQRHCQEASDCPVNGRCSNGCQDGWVMDDCTLACPDGTYGPNCSSICGNCTGDEMCDHETGNCSGDCTPGWRGKQCKQTCPSGMYGVNCVENCGHCTDKCDVVDGRCPGGCLEGYCGTNCRNKLPVVATSSNGQNSEMTAVTGAVIGAIVMLVAVIALCGGLLIFLMRRGRLQWIVDPDKRKESTVIADLMGSGTYQHTHATTTPVYLCDYSALNSETKSGTEDYEDIEQKP